MEPAVLAKLLQEAGLPDSCCAESGASVVSFLVERDGLVAPVRVEAGEGSLRVYASTPATPPPSWLDCVNRDWAYGRVYQAGPNLEVGVGLPWLDFPPPPAAVGSTTDHVIRSLVRILALEIPLLEWGFPDASDAAILDDAERAFRELSTPTRREGDQLEFFVGGIPGAPLEVQVWAAGGLLVARVSRAAHTRPSNAVFAGLNDVNRRLFCGAAALDGGRATIRGALPAPWIPIDAKHVRWLISELRDGFEGIRVLVHSVS